MRSQPLTDGVWDGKTRVRARDEDDVQLAGRYYPVVDAGGESEGCAGGHSSQRGGSSYGRVLWLGSSGGKRRRRDVVDLNWDAESHQGGGEAACLQVIFREHAEEVDGGEVEELDRGVDEDAYAQRSRSVVCCGGHDD